jgi:hypothetical protein
MYIEFITTGKMDKFLCDYKGKEIMKLVQVEK